MVKICFSFLNFVGHPCAGAMLIFSVFISFLLMAPPEGGPTSVCVFGVCKGKPVFWCVWAKEKSLSGLGVLAKKPSTPRGSRAVPQPSTDLALHRLAREFGWDPAFSMQYGRRLIGNN